MIMRMKPTVSPMQNDLERIEHFFQRPAMFSYILGQLLNCMYILDHTGAIVYKMLNGHKSAPELIRLPEEVCFFTRVHPQQHTVVKEALRKLKKSGSKVVFECQWAEEEGGWYWVEAVIMPVPDAELCLDASGMYLLSIRNIAGMKEREEQLTRLAYLDPLTELPNRRAFELCLNQAVANAKRYQQLMALLYTDIDNFKLINDGYGHETGDLLLQAFAARVKGCIREIDTVSRLGGDEFVILLPRIDSIASVRRVAERIMGAIREGWNVSGHRFTATISMGVAVFPTDGQDSGRLLQNVDKALYLVKNSGRNGISYYQPS
jgi:diguanylate cyclase (GGDEF)-like protein